MATEGSGVRLQQFRHGFSLGFQRHAVTLHFVSLTD